MLDYIRDGQEIYRNSFAIIRAEANLARIPADLEKLAVRVIHACGMVEAIDGLQFSEGAGKAGRDALAAGAPKPALILGFPVGFVGAAESKAMLAADSRGVPFVIMQGRLGGSAMAAAAVNALATEVE